MSGSTLVVAAIRRQPAQCLFRIAHQRYCRSSSSRASPYSVARFGSSSQRLSQRFNGTCSIGTASSAIDAATSSKTRAATVTCGKRQVSFRQDVMAWQADGSVIAEDGGSAVLGTVMANPHDVQRGKRVNVTYHEPDASVNVIFKNFLRRQLSETEREVVTTSVLRHVLVPRLRGNHTLHVSCRVLSADGEADPTVLAINAAAAALQRAGVPWDGPVAGVRIARTQRGALVTNPDLKTLEGADWNMLYVGDVDGPVYLSTDAHTSATPVELLDAIKCGQDAVQGMLDCVSDVPAHSHREVHDAPSLDRSMRLSVQRCLDEMVLRMDRDAHDDISRHRLFSGLVWEYMPSLTRLYPMENAQQLQAILHEEFGRIVGERMHTSGTRFGGRALNEHRALGVDQGIVAIPHGSALVSLGASQCFARTTIDPATVSNPIDEVATKFGEAGTNFFVDYKVPAHASANNDTPPPTREHLIAEGSMITSSVLPVLDSSVLLMPTRVHCEVSSYGGSTESVAALASSAALIDAGVKMLGCLGAATVGCFPAAAGGAGAVDADTHARGVDWSDSVVAVDLDAFEEMGAPLLLQVTTHDQDVTGIHMRSSVGGVPLDVIARAFTQARASSEAIGREMSARVSAPLKPKENIPCIASLPIQGRDARVIIGPGGSNIRAIESKSGCRVTVDNKKMVVNIAAPTHSALARAREMVEMSLPTGPPTARSHGSHTPPSSPWSSSSSSSSSSSLPSTSSSSVKPVSHLNLKVGDTVVARVRRMMAFGIVVEADGYSSLVHKTTPGNKGLMECQVGDKIKLRCITNNGSPALVLAR